MTDGDLSFANSHHNNSTYTTQGTLIPVLVIYGNRLNFSLTFLSGILSSESLPTRKTMANRVSEARTNNGRRTQHRQ